MKTWIPRAIEGVILLLWVSTFTLGVAWLLDLSLPFEPEPATVCLGLTSGGLSAVVQYYSNRVRSLDEALDEEKDSTPFVLAYGYLNHFLEPAVTELLQRRESGRGPVRLYVYLPEELAELEPLSRERILAEIRDHAFRDEALTLQFREGRARDILTLKRAAAAEGEVYFDFPTTLLTLVPLIEFKTESQPDSFAEETRRALGREYITRFREALTEMLRRKSLDQYVRFADRSLAFLDAPAPDEDSDAPSDRRPGPSDAATSGSM